MPNRILSLILAGAAAAALGVGSVGAQYAPGAAPAPGGAPAGQAQSPAPMAPQQAQGGQAAAGAVADPEHMAVVAALAKTSHTLSDGIAQVALGTEVPIEAKFEVEDGVLYLSVYTSAMGLETIAEENSFKEYKGDATLAAWAPETEVFEDFEHIARSAQYHTLLSMTAVTIPQIIDAASEGGATVISVKPKVVEGKPVFEVFVMRDGQPVKQLYDLTNGAPTA